METKSKPKKMKETATKTKPTGQNYLVPPHLVEWARGQARARCLATGGEPWTWSMVIRDTLEAAAK